MDKKADKVLDLKVQEQMLTKTIKRIFSRCSVPSNSYEITKMRTVTATLSSRVLWTFEPEIIDKVPDSEKNLDNILTDDNLASLTSRVVKDYRTNNDYADEYLKEQHKSSFIDMLRNAIKSKAIRHTEAAGMVACKKCNGKGNMRCDSCLGTGKVPCPQCRKSRDATCLLCHGSGYVSCSACQGSGSNNCSECLGTGRHRVERDIALNVSAKRQASAELILSENQKSEIEFSSSDLMVLFSNAKMELTSTSRTSDNTYLETYKGEVKCNICRAVMLDVHTSFLFIMVGSEGTIVAKPHVVDFFLRETAYRLERLVNGTEDAESRINTLEDLSNCPLLLRTLQMVGPISPSVGMSLSNKNGVLARDLLSNQYSGTDANIILTRSQYKADILSNVAENLVDNADGFISPAFANFLSGSLIKILPTLNDINPDSSSKWRIAIIISIIFAFIWSIIFDGFMSILVLVAMLCAISAIVSLKFTKNFLLYNIISKMDLKGQGKNIPDLRPEALNSLRLILFSGLISFVVHLVKIIFKI